MTEEQRREQAKELAWRVAVVSGVEYDKALAAVMSVVSLCDGLGIDVSNVDWWSHAD